MSPHFLFRLHTSLAFYQTAEFCHHHWANTQNPLSPKPHPHPHPYPGTRTACRRPQWKKRPTAERTQARRAFPCTHAGTWTWMNASGWICTVRMYWISPLLSSNWKDQRVALSASATVGHLYLRVPESHWESVGWTETGGKDAFLF